tara:strand:- start:318 stop:1364 length:1047 start_codon:yes stop_codon:yes gene_type:complete
MGKFISASYLDALSECKGRFQEESKSPPEEASKLAQAGTLMHSALAGENVTLTQEQRDTVNSLKRNRMQLEEEIFRGEQYRTMIETRLFMFDPFDGKFSGKPDFVAYTNDTALIVDYKTGFNEVIASESWQLRALAVLVFENLSVSRVVCAIAQPFREIVPVIYDLRELAEAKIEIVHLIQSALDEDAPRTPTPNACRYCRAKATCAAARQMTSDISTQDVSAIPIRELPKVLDACTVAEAVIKTIRKRAKTILADNADSITGWALKSGRKTRTITDVGEMRSRIESSKLLPKKSQDKLKISLTEIEREISGYLGITMKEARDVLEKVAGDIIEIKEGEPILSRQGGK